MEEDMLKNSKGEAVRQSAIHVSHTSTSHPNINPVPVPPRATPFPVPILPPVAAMARLSHYGKAVREKKEKGTGGRKGNRAQVPDEDEDS